MNIKPDLERARLDEIFAQVEAEERGEPYTSEASAGQQQHETDLKNCEESLNNHLSQSSAQIVGECNDLIKADALRTKRERFLAKAYVNLYNEKYPTEKMKKFGEMRTELEHYRNFVKAVGIRLYNAIETAKAQDNHHYYKMFAEACKEMMEKL